MNQSLAAFAEEIILANAKDVDITRIALQRLDDARQNDVQPQQAHSSPYPQCPNFAHNSNYYELQGVSIPESIIYAAKVLSYFGRKIQAIKLIRDYGYARGMNIGLKEAKDFVESLSLTTSP
jgi:hypothetical protein